MRFTDPAGLMHLELPAGWALDPLSSSLFQRAFSQWASSEPHHLFVHMDGSASRGTDDDWVRRTVASLPPEVPHHEVTGSSRGPVVWVVRPGREGRPDQRWAIIRGRFADLTMEEVGVPLGGPVRTPTLLAAVSSVQAPLNDAAWESPPGTWNELMDEADAAAGAGDLDRAVDRLLAAHDWALRSWLRSVQEGSFFSRFAIAAAQSRLSLAALQRDVQSLADAVELTHRLSGYVDDGNEEIEPLRSRLFAMCGQVAGQPPPHETWQALELVTGALLKEVIAQGTAGDPEHRRETAETAMRLSASSLLVSRLLHGRPEDRGALDGLEDQALGRLVAAGSAYQAALWGTAQRSPSGVAEEWLAATRLLRSRQPADESLVPVLVSALNAAAGACGRVGDPDAVEREEVLLAEARDLVGDRPESPLHDRVWLLSAWASVHGRRPEEALERSARITATEGDLRRSRASVRATALRLLGRHEEEIAEARRAVGEDDPSDSMHRVALSLALASCGHADEAAAQALHALRSALAENPLGQPVTRSLVTLAHVTEDAVLSLRLTVLAEDLIELQGTTLDDRDEVIGFHEVELHREVVADLVVRLLAAGQTDAALSVAEHARARTLRRGFRVADLPAPPLFLPSEARLTDLLSLVEEYVVQQRHERGLATRLTGPELRGLVARAGRPALLLHPSASGLVRFLLRPDGSGEVDVRAGEGADVVEQVAELQRALGTELTAVSRGEANHELLAALQAWADEPAPEPVDATDHARRRLHDLVFGDLTLPDASLALVPFRELALLPYPALIGDDGSTLLDHHELSMLPSLRSLAGTTLERDGRRAVVLGAPHHDASLGLPPLVHAAEEASEVAALLANAVGVTPPLLGDAATEAALRRQAYGAGILHLACHAAVGATPTESALYLTPGPHDDGAVRLDEAEDLLLDDALVVLAACQTGLGRATADGVVGLGQSFVRAGARCVVLSLWRVGDASTAVLMSHFYRLLVGTSEQPGVDVAAALAGAQRLTRGRFTHVAQWGPWLVTGDGGWRV